MNTIKVKKYGNVLEEFTAGGTITPGMLIAVGSAGTVAAHAVEAGNVLPMFAVEDELQGKDISDNYSSGNKVQCWIPGRGDQVYAWLANGENVVIGDKLVSDGAGKLKKFVSSSDGDLPACIVGEAVEAVDMSGSSAVDPDGRIIVRIL